ncbi:MAG: hypothetical protein ACRDTM_02885 [Micromonosporaceae bacterium]
MGTPLVAARLMLPPGDPVSTYGAVPRLGFPEARLTDSPLEAITDELHRRAGGNPLGVADPLRVTDPVAGGWISASALVGGDALPLLLNGPVERWGAAPHAAAALAWKAYSYWLTLPAIVGLTCVNRVPLLDADNVLVQLSYQAPFVTVGMRRPAVAVLPDDRYAGAPGTVVVPDRDVLLRALADSLVTRHLGPLADATRARVRIGSRILSGSLAASVAYALRFISGLAPAGEGLAAQGKAILDALSVTDLVSMDEAADGTIAVRRHTCCLAFTVPQLSICSTCCIQPEDGSAAQAAHLGGSDPA